MCRHWTICIFWLLYKYLKEQIHLFGSNPQGTRSKISLCFCIFGGTDLFRTGSIIESGLIKASPAWLKHLGWTESITNRTSVSCSAAEEDRDRTNVEIHLNSKISRQLIKCGAHDWHEHTRREREGHLIICFYRFTYLDFTVHMWAYTILKFI